MRIVIIMLLLVASVIFALGGFDILNNAADFQAEYQVRLVGYSLIALSMLLPVLAIAIVFAKEEND
jgi:hypothetical protein